ncbi:hypothetical protein EJ06DRAFT_554939 [Trichodelitschia bisporula]|uniref:Carbohydrate kinase PfkB domain-containing protein n=1 Tax=Trichodelitschia bisporula TaxID=703511 RepID=A0A6G1I2R9_9PEZI|nr:hypothetical protein EJ06DRAFT_554939 [Trichodelitschia bisporula]
MIQSISSSVRPRRLAFGVSGRLRRCYSPNPFFAVSEEVREAVHSNKPIVALETTIYTHGYPYPENVALASELESIVRINGGVPATIGILNGVAKVGMSPEEIIQLASSVGQASTLKLSRRDLAFATGLRLVGKSFHGGTTIASTMILAHAAGIKVFATGGLGGVHRGAETTMDISADLTELGRTPVTVISSGCKSFLDIPKTLEYLETQGVGVATFADGREGKVDFPAFWARESGVRSPMVLRDEVEAAAVIYAQHQLGLQSGLHFANPIPAEAAIAKAEIDAMIDEAICQADAAGASGKDNTPFILNKIKELSGGKSLAANRALIVSNVKRGALVAGELSKLEGAREDESSKGSKSIRISHFQVSQENNTAANVPSTLYADLAPPPPPPSDPHPPAKVLVAGSLALDHTCTFTPLPSSPSPLTPQPRTSNPATITQSPGGVAHNVALTLHTLGIPSLLHSYIGPDPAGPALLTHLANAGMRTDAIHTLRQSRTAQYVSVNDVKNDLVLGMADMGIIESAGAAPEWRPEVPEGVDWLVLDANWMGGAQRAWLRAARAKGVNTALEPVSVPKAGRVFALGEGEEAVPVWPDHVLDLIAPNRDEVLAMHAAARGAGALEGKGWWSVVDALGIGDGGARSRFERVCGGALVDEGVPQCAVQLLPFAPVVLVFPALEVDPSEVVSVNGAGDTFLGAMVARLVLGGTVESAVGFAQGAAVETLRSRRAVGEGVARLKGTGLGEGIMERGGRGFSMERRKYGVM